MMDAPAWQIVRGEGPLVAAAIHAGHGVRGELAPLLAVPPSVRRREEDPDTDAWTSIAPTRIIGRRSRFEVDLNRPAAKAVYLQPEDAWGLTVWRHPPPAVVVQAARALHAAFYVDVERLLEGLIEENGKAVVFDLHSYNHRRGGPDAAVDPLGANPEINVGTRGLDPRRWRTVVEGFVEAVAGFDYPGAVARHRRAEGGRPATDEGGASDSSGRPVPVGELSLESEAWRGRSGTLDVRCDVKFRGGRFPVWINETFSTSACALAIEVKKIFMDEWTGRRDEAAHEALRDALAQGAERVVEELARL